MMGGNLGAAVQMLKVINQQGGGQSWESYWATRLDTWHQGASSEDILIPTQPTILSDADIEYKYDVFHAEFARDNKILAYSDNVLYLSYDCGYSYQKKITFDDCANIGTSKIFANGNILWGTKTKMFLSTDDLTSYNEIIVKDIDGSDWTPTGNADGQSFRRLTYDNPVIVNDVEYEVWGNYGNLVGSSDNSVNVYATIDSGLTIKIIYKFDNIAPNLKARHVHSVSFNPNNNTFIVMTGDYSGECNWLQLAIDTWTPTTLASGDDASWYKTGGMYFSDDYVYWGSDCTNDDGKRTIIRAPIASMLDDAEYVKLFYKLNYLSICFSMNDDGEIISTLSGSAGGVYKTIGISKDSGVTITEKTLSIAGGNTVMQRINPKNSLGWWRMDNYAAGGGLNVPTTWVKIK